MSDESKLESYLERLEKALGPIPTSDRAEIIMEIKSHIHESKDRYPDDSMSGILAGLGEPELVANKYLMERGLKPGKPSKSPIVKWLTIVFLGTLGVLVLSIFVLVWKFTPIVAIDGDRGKVSILGGMISINDSDSKGGSSNWSSNEHRDLVDDKGNFLVKPENKRLKTLFSNIKANLAWSAENQVKWDCKIYQEDQQIIKTEGADIVLSLSTASKCQIMVPKNLPLYIAGSKGKISLDKPTSDYEIDLTNGVVNVDPDPSEPFYYELKTTHGYTDNFESSLDKDSAKKAKISLVNGTIKRN